MKTQAVRIIKFDAGHRVVNHESKCRTFHGHEYRAEIYAEADELDQLGRVVDFSIIKSYIGSWIDSNWDHTMIIYKNDPDIEKIKSLSGAKEPFICDFNPTAENLAAYLLKLSNIMLATYSVKIKKIKLWETSNCYVEVTDDSSG